MLFSCRLTCHFGMGTSRKIFHFALRSISTSFSCCLSLYPMGIDRIFPSTHSSPWKSQLSSNTCCAIFKRSMRSRVRKRYHNSGAISVYSVPCLNEIAFQERIRRAIILHQALKESSKVVNRLLNPFSRDDNLRCQKKILLVVRYVAWVRYWGLSEKYIVRETRELRRMW